MNQASIAPSQPKLLDQLRARKRVLHDSIRTEDVYADWARRFILFPGKRHPKTMGAPEVEAFLTYLAVERKVSASTQNQAKAAVLFLYKEVLKIDLPWLDEVTSARTARRLPVVLTQHEVRELLLQACPPKKLFLIGEKFCSIWNRIFPQSKKPA
jgi:site-specific recombinase XerD